MMNVNPEDYDLNELRQMAAERGQPDHAGHASPAVDDAVGSQNGESTDSSSRQGGAQEHHQPGRQSQQRGPTGHQPHDRSGTPQGQPGTTQNQTGMTQNQPGMPRGNPMPTRGRAADALRSNQLEQLFLHQSAMVSEEMTKPYLAGLPQKYAAERVIFDWLEFLVLKGGFKRAMDALRYYRTIDWITDEVEATLQDYLIGFTDDGRGTQTLDVDDHQLSLLYVARLASMN